MDALELRRKLVGFAGWLCLVLIVAGIGAVGSAEAAPFYAEIAKPGWAPPGWVFGPVWTVLYLLMAAAAWLVWSEGGFVGHKRALVLFLGQLCLNGIWSWLFFRWRLGGLAFVDILLLFIILIIVFRLFWRIRPIAALLFVPYILWTGFAGALNYTVWQLNRDLLK